MSYALFFPVAFTCSYYKWFLLGSTYRVDIICAEIELTLALSNDQKAMAMSRNSTRPFKGTEPTLADDVFIDPSSVVIGDVVLAEGVSIWPLVSIRGDVNHVRIGRNTNIQDGSVIHVSRPSNNNPNGYPVLIGDNVTLGHKVLIHGCVIGNNVLVGMGAIVMDGVIIEDNVMVGAGALVTPGKLLESGFLYTGSPATKKRTLNSDEISKLSISAQNYVNLKNEYQ